MKKKITVMIPASDELMTAIENDDDFREYIRKELESALVKSIIEFDKELERLILYGETSEGTA